MSTIGRRMNHLRSKVGCSLDHNNYLGLMFIRNGPGAAVLPPTITKLHLEFAHKFEQGHSGSRKFWRDHMPSLKYHNPAIPIIVNRSRDQMLAPILTIYATSDHKHGDLSVPLLEAPSKDAIQKPKTAIAVVSDPWQHIGSSSDGSTPAPVARQGEKVIKIELRHVLAVDIWKQFLEKTGAMPVEPSPADILEMERLRDLKEQGEADRRVMQAYNDRLKREKQRLEKARQDAEALKNE